MVKIFCILFYILFFHMNANAQVINRTILTVQDDVYTAAQGELLLVMWQNLQKIDFKFDLVLGQFSKFNTVGDQADLVSSYKKWPKDAQSLVFIATSWWEAKRLSLFSMSQAELEKQEIKMRTVLAQSTHNSVKVFLSEEEKNKLKKSVEQIYRVQAYYKARGDIEKNPSLLSLSWYWHDDVRQ